MIEPTGYTALDLVGFTDKGPYAANVNYVKNDLVHHGGNIWRILIDDTIGITPAEGPNYTVFVGEPINLVERIIAPLEDNPATVAYQTGRQIIYNDHLYEVIQNIGVGDTLIAYEDDPTNANIKLASPVETQVLALNASKVNKSDVVNNVTTTTAGKVLDARQGKALQDGINTKVNTSDVVNNTTTTTAGKVLDARQGKALQDGINAKVNKSDIANNVTTTTAGKVLDARQGKALQDGINAKISTSDIANNTTTTAEGKVLDARQGKALQDDIDDLQDAAENKVLFFQNVACSATTGNFLTKSDAKITANHILTECVFANPSAITTDVTWTTANGSLTLNGTCTSATTATITLVKKDN